MFMHWDIVGLLSVSTDLYLLKIFLKHANTVDMVTYALIPVQHS